MAVIIAIAIIIINTGFFGSAATFGQCSVSVLNQEGGHLTSSGSASVNENQCKEDCISTGNSERDQETEIFCKFKTITWYGWEKTPQEFPELDARIISDYNISKW